MTIIINFNIFFDNEIIQIMSFNSEPYLSCHFPYSSRTSALILSIGRHTTEIEKYGLKS